MFCLDIFKPLAGPRWSMESGIPWGSFDANQLTDDLALKFKTNTDSEWAALPSGAARFFTPIFSRIEPPMRGRGRV